MSCKRSTYIEFCHRFNESSFDRHRAPFVFTSSHCLNIAAKMWSLALMSWHNEKGLWAMRHITSERFKNIVQRPKKHSITLQGHCTSISLEGIFWEDLCFIAKSGGQSVSGLVSEIDEYRGESCTLTSALRLFVLEYHRTCERRCNTRPR